VRDPPSVRRDTDQRHGATRILAALSRASVSGPTSSPTIACRQGGYNKAVIEAGRRSRPANRARGMRGHGQTARSQYRSGTVRAPKRRGAGHGQRYRAGSRCRAAGSPRRAILGRRRDRVERPPDRLQSSADLGHWHRRVWLQRLLQRVWFGRGPRRAGRKTDSGSRERSIHLVGGDPSAGGLRTALVGLSCAGAGGQPSPSP
jgi:hypothetical protein